MRLKTAALLLLLGPAAVPAAAEIELESIRWQVSRAIPARKFEDVADLKATDGLFKGVLRAQLKLYNRGNQAEEGIVLRYSITPRLTTVAGKGEGAWAVPLMVEQRRVPFLGANQRQEVALDSNALIKPYLRKMNRAGFFPDQLKLQVMVEPLQAAKERTIKVLESVLPLTR